MAFPGATSGRESARYAVVGAPLDVTTSFRPGTRFGPDRIRTFARSFEDYDPETDVRLSDCRVHDAGDVRAWPDPAAYVEHLAAELRALVADDVVPLLLGGEHTVAVAGVRAVDPDTLVVCDAHLDLRDSYDGDPLSHACVTRRALETAERAVILGGRSGSEAGWERAEATDVTVVPPDAVGRWLDETALDDLGRVYLSVDVDAADPAVAPGTGTPTPFGMDSRTIREAVARVAPHAVGFDAVEVNDRDDGQAAALAAALLRRFVFDHAAASDEGGG
ncbi:MAG: agmatinase [Haloferacaceae archaeon]